MAAYNSTRERTAPADRSRRTFLGGSDARTIMGEDEAALLRLWREKRGEVEPEDLKGNLIVQLGLATEGLNRRWYEANTGRSIVEVQKHIRHPATRWLGCTLDGVVAGSGAVYEANRLDPLATAESLWRRTHPLPRTPVDDEALAPSGST